MQDEDQTSIGSADILNEYAQELQDLLGDDDVLPVAASGNDVRDKQRELKASRKQELKDRAVLAQQDL